MIPRQLDILLVGSGASLASVRAALEVRGHTVRMAARSEDALERFERDAPDLALIGAEVAGSSGIDVIRRAVVRGLRVPTVLVTAGDAEGEEALRLGASEYLAPEDMSPRAIDRAIRTALRHVEAEEKLWAQESLVQISLARMSQMAAITVHEVRNAVAGIGGALQVIRGRLPEAGLERQISDAMWTRLQSLNDMIDHLLVIARRTERRTAKTSIEALLRDVAELLSFELGVARSWLDLSGPDVSLEADPDLLRLLFHNLFKNALQAMDGVGVVRVVLAAADGVCRVEVTDTGPGVAPELQGKILEPFFSTKREGTGLGLTMARRIAEVYGGKLEVLSSNASGTTLEVTLPLAS